MDRFKMHVVNCAMLGAFEGTGTDGGAVRKQPVIANQCAHWCGNPFPLRKGRIPTVAPLPRNDTEEI